MRVILPTIVLLLSVAGAVAWGVFAAPTPPDRGALEELRRLKVADPARRLSDDEKRELCRTFVRAYVSSVRSPGQSSLLPTSTAAYRLFAANFPEVRARENEAGINLGAIARYINSLPEYRGDVVQVLNEGVSTRWCDSR